MEYGPLVPVLSLTLAVLGVGMAIGLSLPSESSGLSAARGLR